MPAKVFSSITDQVTERLRESILEGLWRDVLPGRKRLIEELGCSQWTLEEAQKRLTKEGLLVSQGAGRRQRIELSGAVAKPRALRVMILPYEKSDRQASYMVGLLHQLRDSGHESVFADQTLRDLSMSVKRIAHYVESTEADAWVVMAGSRDVLEWFAAHGTPALALFGRSSHTSLASVSLQKSNAMVELADRLVELGHRRIVILTREERRTPNPAFLEQLFLDHLKERGIPTGSYNLPDWGDSAKEFRQVIDSLYRHTPPTALIVDQPSLCVAALQHLSRLGLSVPNDVSLACTDMSKSFNWCDPAITHISWDSRVIIRRAIKWATQISHGKDDRHKHSSKAKLVLGGTIGPAPTGSFS